MSYGSYCLSLLSPNFLPAGTEANELLRTFANGGSI